MKIGRWRTILLWILAIIVPSTIASVVFMLLFPENYIYPASTDLRLITDFNDVLLMMPLGWMLNFILPTGWIAILMLLIALYWQRKWPIYVVILVSFIYGLFWPVWFTGFMGI